MKMIMIIVMEKEKIPELELVAMGCSGRAEYIILSTREKTRDLNQKKTTSTIHTTPQNG